MSLRGIKWVYFLIVMVCACFLIWAAGSAEAKDIAPPITAINEPAVISTTYPPESEPMIPPGKYVPSPEVTTPRVTTTVVEIPVTSTNETLPETGVNIDLILLACLSVFVGVIIVKIARGLP